MSANLKRTTLHSFHIVDVSPWPLTTSFAAFATMLGLTLYMHSYESGFFLFFVGLIATTINATLWWRDIVREGTFEGAHTFAVQHGLRFGMILFIVSEVMLFFAFFWAFFHSALNPIPQIGCVWPPKGIEVVEPFMIPALNTILLLTSGASLTWAHSALIGGYRLEVITSLLLTLVLASCFTAFQVYEYLNAPFHLSDGVYGSTFYMLTGLHGFHVFVGTLFLSVALYRVIAHHFTTHNHIGFEAAAWYWHFVDIVWIFLFLAIYNWGQAS